MARWAAHKAGNEKHSFTTLQMPGNLIETESLKGCAIWATKQGLNVLINRPLNAYHNNRLFRLVSYPEAKNYQQIYERTIFHFANKKTKTVSPIYLEIARYLTYIHENIAQFQSPDHYEYVFYRQILPFFHQFHQELEQEDLILINSFLDVYRDAVLSIVSRKTVLYLESVGYKIKEPLEEYSLKFLLNNPNVTCVLLGMRKERYVDTAIKVLQQEK